MNNSSYMLVLWFGVVLSSRLTMAIGGFEMELLMTKLDFLQDKLQEVEHTMKTAMEHIESKMHAMEDSLKKSVKTSEENTRKLAENKEILDMLTKSMHNINTNAETRSKTLADHLIAPVRSCRQVTNDSGTYLFRLRENSKPFEVFCEQNKFEGGWTVIQHRFDGSVDFYRNWTEYRNGFGNIDGEFWLGLEYMHQITKNRPHELLVEMKDFQGNYGYAKYGEFEIGDESEKYVLKKLGTNSGTAGDSMEYHKNQKFTTFDRDNDPYVDVNCAEHWHGAWWYNRCHYSHLNGRYQNTRDDVSAMVWARFKNDWRGLSYSRMMIRDIIN